MAVETSGQVWGRSRPSRRLHGAWVWRCLAGLLVAWACLAQWGVAGNAGAQEGLADNAAPVAGVLLLRLRDAIGPATAEYVLDGLAQARRARAGLVVLQIDTPGGLDSAMRDIIQGILASPVPVATYVAPSGARAASAGTYILYASHIAAMAPGTNLGAATPVQMGGKNPLLPEDLHPPRMPGAPGGEDGGTPDDNPASGSAEQSEKATDAAPTRDADAMRHKVINDAAAYIRSLADLRGRNADWAEQAVRRGASLPAEEALEQGVIDLMASSLADLLQQLDGRDLALGDGELVLRTRHAPVVEFEPDWRHRFLAVVTNPSVTYVLIMIGLYGLFFEFSNPGAVIPGVAGAVSLLLAAYGLQLLPVNYAGLGLLLLGLALMVAEAFVPAFGALGIGGVVAFVVGSVILMDTGAPGFGIPWPLIAAVTVAMVAGLTLLLGTLLRLRRRRPVTGSEELLGMEGSIMPNGPRVRVHGEVWELLNPNGWQPGQRVRVVAREGLKLRVEPVATEEKTT